MANPLYATYGLEIVQAVGGYLQAGIQAKLQRKLQKYRNAMLEVSAAMNDNATNRNEIDIRDASVRMGFAIQQIARRDRGSAEVNAAATGVKGASVDAAMRGLSRSAANAQAARKANASSQMAAQLQGRRNTAFSLATNRDITVIPKPSLLAAGVGLGKTLLNAYDDDQPEGDKISDTIGAWWSN